MNEFYQKNLLFSMLRNAYLITGLKDIRKIKIISGEYNDCE